MIVDEAITIVESLLAPERLNSLQEMIIRKCWEEKSYQAIAEESGYAFDYIRVIGSQLWQKISSLIGEKVTKNNFRSVLRQIASEHMKTQIATLEIPDRPVPLNSPFYVKRPPSEELAFEEISKPGAIVRIKAPPKWGKTSLMLRILEHANLLGYHTVRIDWRQADSEVLKNLDKLLRWLCANISRQLGFEAQLDKYWDDDLGSKVSCTNYLQEYILEQIDRPLVLALDEVNRIFEYRQTAKDFLPLLRFWHEEANNLAVWQKLRPIVVYSTEVYVALDINRSPFNVGLAIKLPKFQIDRVQDLAQRHQLHWVNSKEGSAYLSSLLTMTNGHPYLIRLAFYELTRQQISVEKFLQEAALETSIYSNILRGHLRSLQQNPEMGEALRQVIMADNFIRLDSLAAYKLESTGSIDLVGDRATISCNLYRQYFRERLQQF
jgi:AAA-like domain